MKRALALGALLVASLAASPASAQEYLMAASGHVASGAESAGHGVQRAPTRLRIGFELRVDEMPDEGIVMAGLVDLEPRSGFGGEVRWIHTLGTRFAFSAGGVAYLAPGTLFGPCAGLEVRFPFAKGKAALVVGPEVNVFVAGSDLPSSAVTWQTLLQVGVRADL